MTAAFAAVCAACALQQQRVNAWMPVSATVWLQLSKCFGMSTAAVCCVHTVS